MRRPAAIMISCCLLLVACGTDNPTSPTDLPRPTSTTPSAAPTSATPTSATPTSAAPTSADPTSESPEPSPGLSPDPRNKFFTPDVTRYSSDWYAGKHRIMIEYGCTPAPYYNPDPRCDDGQGFHHGIDIALPCGNEIRAGRSGRVIDPGEPGTPGAAYGSTAFRIRTKDDQDILIGHARKVFVEPGDRVRRGDLIALAGARGAPDGCHLHLEVRSADGGVSSARNPANVIGLRA